MTPDDLLAHHHELEHPCVVHPHAAPDLVVTCTSCGTRLEAELLSPCRGGRQDERVILMLRCPNCRAKGQLRVQRAPRPSPPDAPPATPMPVTIESGGPGYLFASCSCGAVGSGIYLHGYGVTATELTLDVAVQRCGHRFSLRLCRNEGFTVEPHRHGSTRAT